MVCGSFQLVTVMTDLTYNPNGRLCAEDILVPHTGDTSQLSDTMEAFRRLWLAALPWRRPRILKAALAEVLAQHRQFAKEWTEFFKALDDRFKKVYKDKASTAVEGMVETTAGIEVARLEKQYKALIQNPTGDPAERIATAFEVARAQIAILALAHEKLTADLSAKKTQATQYQEFIKLYGQPREMAIFLKEQFPNTWAEQSEKGAPFTQIAQHIMLSLKEGRAVN